MKVCLCETHTHINTPSILDTYIRKNRVPLWTVAMQHFSDWVSRPLVRVYVFTPLLHPSSSCLTGHSCSSKAKDGGRERERAQSSFLEEVQLSTARFRFAARLGCLLGYVECWLGLKYRSISVTFPNVSFVLLFYKLWLDSLNQPENVITSKDQSIKCQNWLFPPFLSHRKLTFLYRAVQ